MSILERAECVTNLKFPNMGRTVYQQLQEQTVWQWTAEDQLRPLPQSHAT